jgi:hypothetical protein
MAAGYGCPQEFTPVYVRADGYEDPPGLGGRYVLVNGDTRFDMQMVRR